MGHGQQSQATLDTVMGFMGAMGSGDMETMLSLMADDMVWHNEGDAAVPWIGPWEGKDAIFGFTGEFTFALRAKVRDGQVTLWNWFEDSYALSQAFHD
jgi:ketosteroid isomerase-like protein